MGRPDGTGDEGLVVGVSNGDPHAFAALFDPHGAVVLRVCRARLGCREDAEDASASTFATAWHLRDRARLHDSSLRPWLLSIAVNEARNLARSERRGYAAARRLAGWPAEAGGGIDDGVVDAVSARQDSAVVAAAIQSLPRLEKNATSR